MKHNFSITLLLLGLFIASHLIGLVIINHYLPIDQPLPLNIEKPQLEAQTSYLPIFIAILLATALALLLMKFEAMGLWKLWFFLSVTFSLTVAFAAFVPQLIALPLSLLLAVFKTLKPNIIIHNFTELFIYGGLAAIFTPVLNVFSAIILLLLISLYDAVAVWKTHHMISLAKFQSKSKMFAGLYVPYEEKKIVTLIPAKHPKYEQDTYLERQAILGGGDIGFPLLFSGVMLKFYGAGPAIITSLTAALALFFLLTFAKKEKFYPAMPFITAGCLLGYALVWFAYL